MENIKLDLNHSNIKQEEIMIYASKVTKIHEELHEKSKDENEFLGWLDLPSDYDKKEVEKIKKCAKKIQKDSEVLVVIGIGGSYLGARAVIESLTNTFYNSLPKEQRKTPQILYAGNNLNPNYLNDLIELIGNRDLSINVISKSGTTTEPAVAFRIFRELLENKYGLDEARKRIYVTTDKKRGALKQIADEEGYTTFVIPDNIGGRYSVLTAVGLLPIATAGINIDKLLEGAKIAQGKYLDKNLKYNDCYKYAVVRNILYKNEKNIEILVSYEPKLHYIIEWWKQLYGESEGKDLKGIYPTGAEFTTDLHSLGQYIQEGRRNLFETVIDIKEADSDVFINQDEDNLDELNYLVGKGLDYVNKKAMEGTIEAHVDGGVPNIILTVDKLNECTIGHLIYFFELACAMSGRLLEVNPFNQPGVEKYKKNMFRLLGKPGYVEEKKVKEEKAEKPKRGRKKKEQKI
jgi:glucose-6-phosphate isomerase